MPSVTTINSNIDNAIDKVGTDGNDNQNEQIINSLWDRTFVSYAPEMIVKLPYYFVANYTQIPGSSPQASNQFKVNSLYDPDLTGVGHQALGRDTWAGIYDYYKILETRIHTVHRMNQNITGTVNKTADGVVTDSAGSSYYSPLFVGGLLDITANPPSSLTVWKEASHVTSNSQERFTKIQTISGMVGRKYEAHHTMVWKPEMFDTAVINDATQNTWTPVGSDPANLNYYSDLIYNSAGGLTVAYQVEVEMTFLVAFKNVNRNLMHTTN